MLININSFFLNTRNKRRANLTYLTLTMFPLGFFLQVDKKYPSQSCSVSKETIEQLPEESLVQQFIWKCQYHYTLLDQSIPLVTVRSNVSLLTEQLWGQPNLELLCYSSTPIPLTHTAIKWSKVNIRLCQTTLESLLVKNKDIKIRL